MDKQSFLTELQDVLEIDKTLFEETNLKELEEWDSMTAMILIGFVSDKFEVELSPKNMLDITTVSSLILKIGTEKFS